jgi:hypothetical protein
MIKNNIDLTNKRTQQKYLTSFSKLDMELLKLLNKLTNSAQIVIITNAMKKWVDTSCVMLPNTYNVIKKHIPVLSAKDLYKPHYPNDMKQWKKHTFKNLIAKSDVVYSNIISVGDAEYEFMATVELYDSKAHTKHKLLKTVRLFMDPTFDALINQLNLLHDNFDKIISCNRHLDLKFSNN